MLHAGVDVGVVAAVGQVAGGVDVEGGGGRGGGGEDDDVVVLAVVGVDELRVVAVDAGAAAHGLQQDGGRGPAHVGRDGRDDDGVERRGRHVEGGRHDAGEGEQVRYGGEAGLRQEGGRGRGAGLRDDDGLHSCRGDGFGRDGRRGCGGRFGDSDTGAGARVADRARAGGRVGWDRGRGHGHLAGGEADGRGAEVGVQGALFEGLDRGGEGDGFGDGDGDDVGYGEHLMGLSDLDMGRFGGGGGGKLTAVAVSMMVASSVRTAVLVIVATYSIDQYRP